MLLLFRGLSYLFVLSRLPSSAPGGDLRRTPEGVSAVKKRCDYKDILRVRSPYIRSKRPSHCCTRPTLIYLCLCTLSTGIQAACLFSACNIYRLKVLLFPFLFLQALFFCVRVCLCVVCAVFLAEDRIALVDLDGAVFIFSVLRVCPFAHRFLRAKPPHRLREFGRVEDRCEFDVFEFHCFFSSAASERRSLDVPPSYHATRGMSRGQMQNRRNTQKQHRFCCANCTK